VTERPAIDLRIIRGEDVRELLAMADCVALMSRTMIAVSEERAVIPLRSVVKMPGDIGMMGNMGGFFADPECYGVKIVSLSPRNVGTAFSSHLGIVLLFETAHCRPVAILDAGEITALRTAAASALATNLLALPDAGDLAILGTGEQAVSHLEAMGCVRSLRRVRAWSPNPASAERFAREQSDRTGLIVEKADSPRDCVLGADIICAVSKAHDPILFGEDVANGAHVNLVGSSIVTSAEADIPLVAKARYFVDLRLSAMNEAGELRRALDAGAVELDHLLGEIGEVANGSLAGRVSGDDITIYKSLGIAAQDLAAAHLIHERALARGIGQTVKF
jgi:ornithine cyclodeaminase/alanine dehydrogenase-like protein (mu-crystallin family)